MKIRLNNKMFFRFISPEAKSFQNKFHVEMISALGEEKNKDILDSIRYARRIQQSLLPTERYMSRYLTRRPNSVEQNVKSLNKNS